MSISSFFCFSSDFKICKSDSEIENNGNYKLCSDQIVVRDSGNSRLQDCD